MLHSWEHNLLQGFEKATKVIVKVCHQLKGVMVCEFCAVLGTDLFAKTAIRDAAIRHAQNMQNTP